MANGINYPIYIEKPGHVGLTKEQFHKLSFFGIASLFLSWKFVVEFNDDLCIVYGSYDFLYTFFQTKRFEGCNFWKNESVDMIGIDIPLTHPLIDVIKKKFETRILINEKI